MSYFSALSEALRAEAHGQAVRMPWTLSCAAKPIAAKYGISVSELSGPRGSPIAAAARQELMWVLHRRGLSSVRIGQLIGRDHTTVLHGVRRHEERMRRAA